MFPQDFTTVAQCCTLLPQCHFLLLWEWNRADVHLLLWFVATGAKLYIYNCNVKLWREDLKKCHRAGISQISALWPTFAAFLPSFTWYSMQVFYTHTLICTAGWIAPPAPPPPPPHLSGSLLEFPAVHQSLFSQVIAQGILIKVKICCWEVTFQTSCDFRCEIKWADFLVRDKHPVTGEGYFTESAPCSDPRHHVFGILSGWIRLIRLLLQTRQLSHLKINSWIWLIQEWSPVSSASQTAPTW